jgi:tyrosyl-tRNA synthetase
VRVFQERQIPEEMPEYALKENEAVLDVLVQANMVSSKSEGRRIIAQDGVRLNGVVLKDALAPLTEKGVLQVGKRKFLKIV